MRFLPVVLIALTGLVQAELWLGKGGLPHVWSLRQDLAQQQAANERMREHNTRLAAEVADLKEGLEMIEEKARSEMGMIRPDEVLVVVTAPKR